MTTSSFFGFKVRLLLPQRRGKLFYKETVAKVFFPVKQYFALFKYHCSHKICAVAASLQLS